MAIITYPLDGITYDADDAQTYLCTRTSGVFDSDDCFAITVTDDLTVTIAPGLAWIKNADYAGKSVCVTESVDLDISVGTNYPRIDRVVLRFSKADNASELAILEGTSSVYCEAPDLTQTETVYELGLYEIYVAKNATSIDEDVITDTRSDDTVCGLMKDAVTSSSDSEIGSAGSKTVPIYANNDALYECFNNASTALGINSSASSYNSTAYGHNATSTANAVAVGCDAKATAYATAIGYGSYGSPYATAVGLNASASNAHGIAIGYLSNTDAQFGVAIGDQANAPGQYSVAVGTTAKAQYCSVAIGKTANASANDAIAIGQLANSSANAISLGYDTDAKNLSVAIGTEANASATNSIAVGYGSEATATNAIAIGHGAVASGAKAIAIGDSASSSANAITMGYSTNAGSLSIAIGRNASAANYNSIAIGVGSNADYIYCTAIGHTALAPSVNSSAFGASANAYASYATAVGSGAKANVSGATAVGNNARALSNEATALGESSKANGSYSTALGTDSVASNDRTLALGFNAHATASYATAIGRGSSCANANGIQLGHSSSTSSLTCKVSLTTTSDIRDKTDVEELGDGATEFIKSLKAIRFVFNQRENYIDEENLTDEEKEKLEKYGMCAYDTEAYEAGTKKGTRIRGGVSAQEVQTALESIYGDSSYTDLVNDNLYDFDADEIPDDVESKLAVNYTGFIPYLIKAIQEIDTRVSDLEDADTASEEDDTSQA